MKRFVLHAYDGGVGNDGALCLKPGQVVDVKQSRDDGWALGTIGELHGWFPLSYTREATADDLLKSSHELKHQNSSDSSMKSSPHPRPLSASGELSTVPGSSKSRSYTIDAPSLPVRAESISGICRSPSHPVGGIQRNRDRTMTVGVTPVSRGNALHHGGTRGGLRGLDFGMIRARGRGRGRGQFASRRGRTPAHLQAAEARPRSNTTDNGDNNAMLNPMLAALPPPLATSGSALKSPLSQSVPQEPKKKAMVGSKSIDSVHLYSAPAAASLPVPLAELPPPLVGEGGNQGGNADPLSPRPAKMELEKQAQLFLASEALANMGVAKFEDGPLVHSVSIAEFDLTEGNTIRKSYPPNAVFSDKEELANRCFPEGADGHHHDWTTLCLWEDGPLFGMAFFSKLEDTSLQRGAIQQSILLLGRLPYFHVYQKILNSALQRYFAKGRNDAILKEIFDAVNCHKTIEFGGMEMITFRLWDCDWQFEKPKLKRDTDLGTGASLVTLVKHLKHYTMHLRYSLLNLERVLFSGSRVKASVVGNCCLAAPLLTMPLSGYAMGITPYVSITDLSPLQKQSFICGITNPLFEDKPGMWDTLISFTRKKDAFVFKPHIKPTSKDRKFIDGVLKEIEKGGQDASSIERWVRSAFVSYNKEMLTHAMSDALPKAVEQCVPNFTMRPMFVSYRMRKRNRVATHLETKIAERPKAVELVKKNILLEANHSAGSSSGRKGNVPKTRNRRKTLMFLKKK